MDAKLSIKTENKDNRSTYDIELRMGVDPALIDIIERVGVKEFDAITVDDLTCEVVMQARNPKW
jgi:hypothetical protein